MLKIAIVIGSTRPDRKSDAVVKWAYDIARQRSDAEFELLDIADFNLPLLDEPLPAASGQYSQPHTRAWLAKVAAFIGYGYTMGARAIEHLRLVMGVVQVATVRPQVRLSLFADFESLNVFKPAAMQEENVNTMLDHVIAWGGALQPLRDRKGEKR